METEEYYKDEGYYDELERDLDERYEPEPDDQLEAMYEERYDIGD